MGHKQLLFSAPAWRETLDEKTGTLIVRAELSSEGFCETIATPVPGSDPPQLTYSCLNVTCDGECELQRRTLPDGTTIYVCECVGGSGGEAVATSSGVAKRSAKRSSSEGAKKGGSKGSRGGRRTRKR